MLSNGVVFAASGSKLVVVKMNASLGVASDSEKRFINQKAFTDVERELSLPYLI